MHTALMFCENAPTALLAGEAAASEDMRQICNLYRAELGEMWRSVAGDPVWQQIWARFVEGRVDLSGWRSDMLAPTCTPSKKNKAKRKSWTPDKCHSSALIPQASVVKPPEEVTVLVAASTKPPSNKDQMDDAACGQEEAHGQAFACRAEAEIPSDVCDLACRAWDHLSQVQHHAPEG